MAAQQRVTRRTFLGAAGAAGLALAGAAPVLADDQRSPRRMVLHVLSDVHISDVYPMTMQDMRVSLQDLQSVAPDPDALIINGDLTEYGHAQDYPLFDLALASSPHPHRVLLNIGNHEFMNGLSDADAVKRYLAYTKLASVFYQTEVKGYPFVFAGSLAAGFNATLGQAQLDWLKTTLAACARPDRPTFFFLHQPPDNVVERAQLEAILRATPNVIYFWGHWHEDLGWYKQGGDTHLLTDQLGYWMVSTGATTYLWQYSRRADGSTAQTFRADWKQGVLVEVYDNSIVVRARDFLLRKWVDGYQATIPIS